MNLRPLAGWASLAAGVWLAASVSALAQSAPQAIAVTSPTLKEGAVVPRQHTPDGRNDSPALAWANAPASTKAFAVVCDDPDAGNPPPFTHWVVYNVPATAKGLPEAMPIDPTAPLPAGLAGTVQGTNGFRRAIYRGPAPPPGKVHHYHFVVYALDTVISMKPGQVPLNRAELTEAMKGHIVGQGELVATYAAENRAASK